MRAARGALIRTRRVRQNVSHVQMDSPPHTSTPAVWLNVKVSASACQLSSRECIIDVPTYNKYVCSVCSMCLHSCMHVFPAQCKPGSSSLSGLETCESCPLGQYQPSFGSRSCLPCPPKTSTVNRGAVDSTECGGELHTFPHIHFQTVSIDHTFTLWLHFED